MQKSHDENEAEGETRAMLVECRALLADNHFVYISGDHGSGWVDKDSIFVEPKRIARLVRCWLARCGGSMRRSCVGRPRAG